MATKGLKEKKKLSTTTKQINDNRLILLRFAKAWDKSIGYFSRMLSGSKNSTEMLRGKD